MANTSQQDVRHLPLPCVHYTVYNLDDQKINSLVNLAHNIFVQLCPKGVKIITEEYSKLRAKKTKKNNKCLWNVIYCQDDDAQLSIEQVTRKIRMAKPQNTKIVKEEPYHVDKRHHLAVSYLVKGCKCTPSKLGTGSRLKVPKHYANEDSNYLCSLAVGTRLEKIEYIANNAQNPIKKICWMLGLNLCKKKQLDNWLVEAFQDYLPDHFDLLARYETAILLSRSYPRDQEYPTLLHFAARFGLEKFVLQILERPEGAIACYIKNKYDMTPAESAESDGLLELAMMIRRYTRLNQFCNMYTKCKEISFKLLKMDKDSTISLKDFEGLHKVSFPLDYFYKSSTLLDSFYKSTLLNFVYCQSLQKAIRDDSGRLSLADTWSHNILHLQNLLLKSALNESPPKCEQSQAPYEFKIPKEFQDISLKMLKIDDKTTIRPKVFEDLHKVSFLLGYFYKSTLSSDQPQSLQPGRHHDSGCSNPDESAPSEPLPKVGSSQAPCIKISKKFLEILNDFNNKLQSNADLEKLVEDWNNRNNVWKSFKEKKENLKEMSLRYEKIEMEMEESVNIAKNADRANTFFEMTQTQDKNEISSPSIGSMHSQKPANTFNSSMQFQKPVNTFYSSIPSEATRTFMETIEIPSDNEELKERPMATPETLSVKKESGTQLPPCGSPVSETEENYEEYVFVDADKYEATHDMNETIDDNSVKNALCTIS